MPFMMMRNSGHCLFLYLPNEIPNQGRPTGYMKFLPWYKRLTSDDQNNKCCCLSSGGYDNLVGYEGSWGQKVEKKRFFKNYLFKLV